MSKRSIGFQSELDERKFGALRIFVLAVCFFGGLIVVMKLEVASFYIALGVPAAIAAFATLFHARLTKTTSVGSFKALHPG